MGLKKIDWYKYFGEWSKNNEWKEFLNNRYMYSVLKYLSQEYKSGKIIYPRRENIFKAFKLCNPHKIKVVILGQDPYYDGRATGLAFANEGLGKLSPSLKHIINSVEKDVHRGLKLDFDITLESWAQQGVLLLNTALTVQHNKPNSHKKVWDKFTKFVISYIAENKPGTIFLLWGNEAEKYKNINGYDINSHCYVKTHFHPAYAERKNIDWNCKHFSAVNRLIEQNNGKEFCIKW